MEPLWKEHVDLVHVLFERGVAGRIVLHVIGRAQAFAGVEGDFRRLAVGLAARGARAPDCAQGRGTIGQGLVIVLEGGQQQLGQMLTAQYVDGETGHNQRGHHGDNVQNAAQPLPALPLRVEKYLFIKHDRSRLFYVRENRENGQRYTVRIVWKPFP